MTEQRKAVIKNADMSEEMQQDAVDIASAALAKYNIEKTFFVNKQPTNATCTVSTTSIPPTSVGRMSSSLTLSRRLEGRRISKMDCVNEILDRQQRLAAMASDTGSLYSIVDLQMLVEHCKESAKLKILAYYGETYLVVAPAPEELVLHAAAELKVSPLNSAQLVQDYPTLIRHENHGVLPLHVVVAATGVDHAGRVKAFLDAFPEAAKVMDAKGLLPVQIALLHGAEWEVIKLLIDAFPAALQYPFLPCVPVPEEFCTTIGLRPFHMACSLKYELNFLFQLLAESQDSIAAAASRR
ncbi:hypothetical protein ACHAWT_006936 [Skeletonema menzelii]